MFLAFAVIVATLVGQGLTLPPLIRRFGLVTRDEQDVVLVAEARRRLTVMALSRIDDLAQTDRFPDRGDGPDPDRLRVPAGPHRPPARGDRAAGRRRRVTARTAAGRRRRRPARRRPRGRTRAAPAGHRRRADRARPAGRPPEDHRAGGRRGAGRPRRRRDDHAPLTTDRRPEHALQGASGETPCRYRLLIECTGFPVRRRMGPGSG